MSLPVGEIGKISSSNSPFDHDSWGESISIKVARIARTVKLKNVMIAICWYYRQIWFIRFDMAENISIGDMPYRQVTPHGPNQVSYLPFQP